MTSSEVNALNTYILSNIFKAINAIKVFFFFFFFLMSTIILGTDLETIVEHKQDCAYTCRKCVLFL